jgi:hypothetical protein
VIIEARQNAFSPLKKDFGLEKVFEIVIIRIERQRLHFPGYFGSLQAAMNRTLNRKTTLYYLKQKLLRAFSLRKR